MQVVETFQTLQGEGKFLGVPSYFIRTTGCNLRCIGYKKGSSIPIIEFADGKKKPIWEVKVGDKILSINEYTKQLEDTIVKKVIINKENEWLEVFFNKGSLIVTPEHPFMDISGKWKMIKNFKVGEEILHITGNEKLSYIKRGYLNPMKNKKTKEKQIRNTNWVLMGKQVSKTIKTKQQNGTYIPSLQILKDKFPLKYKNYLKSIRGVINMGKKNAMKRPEVVIKSLTTNLLKGRYKSQAEKNFEKILIDMKIDKLIWYTGLNSFFITNTKRHKVRNPDFKVHNSNKVIEVSEKSMPWRNETWNMYVKNSIKFYKECGYECICIDMEQTDDVIKQSVLNFIRNGIKIIKIKKCKEYIRYLYNEQNKSNDIILNKLPTRKNTKSIKILQKMKTWNFECFPNQNFIVNICDQRLISHNCSWKNVDGSITICDTPYTSFKPEVGYTLNIDKVLTELKTTKIKHIVITGGEVCLQNDLVEVVKEFNAEGYKVTLETNGTIYREDFDDIIYIDNVFFSLSPKLKGSYNQQNENEKKLHEINNKNMKESLKKFISQKLIDFQLKFVVSNEEDFLEIQQLQQELGFSGENIYCMPQGVTQENLNNISKWLWDRCTIEGWNMTLRAHINIFGDKRGI